MLKKDYSHIPTFVQAGESSAAKTHTGAKLVRRDFVDGMESLTGKGMTTPWQTETIIDPELECATIWISVISNDEIRAKITRNLQSALVSECKNVIGSLPESNDGALLKFINEAVEKRSKLTDETFRIHRLLINQRQEYLNLLTDIFSPVIKESSNPFFRNNYRETAGVSKTDATNMVEMLVINGLDEPQCQVSIDSLVDLISMEIKKIQHSAGFCDGVITDLSPERFLKTLQVITNSENEIFVEIPSIACGLESVTIAVPGMGIRGNEGGVSPFRIIDVVGFNNDGFNNIAERLRQAVLTKYTYDGILYFASKKNAVNKMHEEYLSSIFSTMRPAKLIIVSTFMDYDEIYDGDEHPDEEMINAANNRRKVELLNLVRNIAIEDARVILPLKEDVICIANKVSKKRNGEAAMKVYDDSQYDDLREALGRSIQTLRRRIRIGLDGTANFLKPENPVKQHVGEIVNLLGNKIDAEYTTMRGFSLQIHHWTLDAVLWNLLYGYQHVSDAKVWKNVSVTTFSDMERVCLERLGEFKFIPEAKISTKDDAERIKNEFEANLRTSIYYVVRKLVLANANNQEEESDYKKEIRELARKSKFNKWKIVDDLRLCLMKAVAQPEYLRIMLEDAVNKAQMETYQKLLY